MEYKKINKGAYNIHLIKNNDFKEIIVKVYLQQPLKKEDITMRNVLIDVLTYSTKTYNTNKLFNIREQELYSSNVRTSNYRTGRFLTTVFSIDVLEDKYTEEGNLAQAITFLSEVLYNPNVNKNRFDPKTVNIVKKDIKDYLERIKENTALYSVVRLLENMDKDRPDSYRMFGYLEDLQNINATNLYKHYKNMVENSIMNIYVIGNFNFDDMEQLIGANFKSKVLKKAKHEYQLDEVKALRKPQTIIESSDYKQSKLVIGYRLKKLSLFEENYVLPAYNSILGDSTGDSKLFNTIREKYSYAYYIYSTHSRLDRNILIHAGISKENFDNVLKLVENIMKDMKKGKITLEEVKKAKESLIGSCHFAMESPYRIINMYYNIDILNGDDYKTTIDKIKKITKKDIIRLAKKIKIDTIYCLKGEDQ